MTFYGTCPKCGADGISRERRINGNDTCQNNHKYPSRTAIISPCTGEIPEPEIDFKAQNTLMIEALEKIHNLKPTENQPDFSYIKIAAEVLDIVNPTSGSEG